MPAQNRTYTERDMMRMQQDAVARVREMQERARQTVEGEEHGTPASRSWNQNPGVQRRSRGGQNQSGSRSRAPQQPPRHQAPAPEPPAPEPPQEPAYEMPPPPPPSPPHAGPPPPKGDTTVIQDILSAVGIDDDRLLIGGLLLLLINAKADTTLILALAYLLI